MQQPTVTVTPLKTPTTHPLLLVALLGATIREMRQHDLGCAAYGLNLLRADLIEQTLWEGTGMVLAAGGLSDDDVAELQRWQLQ